MDRDIELISTVIRLFFPPLVAAIQRCRDIVCSDKYNRIEKVFMCSRESIAICVVAIISAVILPASLTVQLRCVKSKSLVQSSSRRPKKMKRLYHL